MSHGILDCACNKFRLSWSRAEGADANGLTEGEAYDLLVPFSKCLQEFIAFNANGGQEFTPESPSPNPLVLCFFLSCLLKWQILQDGAEKRVDLFQDWYNSEIWVQLIRKKMC